MFSLIHWYPQRRMTGLPEQLDELNLATFVEVSQIWGT